MTRDRLYQYLARDLAVRCQRRIGPKCGPCLHNEAQETETEPEANAEADAEAEAGPASLPSQPSTPPATPEQGSFGRTHAPLQPMRC